MGSSSRPAPPLHPALEGFGRANSAPAPLQGEGERRGHFGPVTTWDARQPDLDAARILALHAQGRTTAQIAHALEARFVHVAEWFRQHPRVRPHSGSCPKPKRTPSGP